MLSGSVTRVAVARGALAAWMLILSQVPAHAQPTEPAIVVDHGAVARSLTGVPGDATRGRDLAMDRDSGDCVLCHALPHLPANIVAGTVGPPLTGVGARLSAGQLRLRLIDSTRINPDSVMPAYHRTSELTQVAVAYRGKPILTAQQVEDIIAYLQGLQ